MKTAGPAAKIELTPDRKLIKADGQDLCFVTVTITDKNGQLVPRSNNRVHFTVEGPGELIATDNGDATSHEPFQQNHRAAYNGLCLAVVRSKADEAGKIVLRAESEGLKSREIVIRSK
jgi:beta-galactosidase